jgi:putative membrane protein
MGERRRSASEVTAGERVRLTWAERSALGVAGLALVGFGAYGFSRHEPSTLAYLLSVTVLGAGVAGFRREPLPGWLALALAGLGIGHLAGGLVTVGGDVLYNAHPSLHLLQYDHVFHASASGIAAVVVWRFLSPQLTSATGAILVAALGGLGVGAINELIEFLATLAHHGSHVGGYRNTGWDLLSNTVGTATAMLATAVASRRRRPL